MSHRHERNGINREFLRHSPVSELVGRNFTLSQVANIDYQKLGIYHTLYLKCYCCAVSLKMKNFMLISVFVSQLKKKQVHYDDILLKKIIIFPDETQCDILR
jgi:hypothetical protein